MLLEPLLCLKQQTYLSTISTEIMNKYQVRSALIVSLVCLFSACYGQVAEEISDGTTTATDGKNHFTDSYFSKVKVDSSSRTAAASTRSQLKTAKNGDSIKHGPFERFDYEPLQIVFKEKKYTVLIVNPEKVEIGLDLLKEGSSLSEMEDLAELASKEGKKLKMAMNAGMFDPSYKPLGLYVDGGKSLYPINLKTDKPGNFYALPPNGIFAIDSNNIAYIVETANFSKVFANLKIKIATQSGPMMVIDGKFNKAFNAGSSNLNVRNGVGVTANNRVIFAISDEKVNFYEFSELMRDFLSCDNALYLDGLVSHLYLPEFNKNLRNKYPLGPILTITEKK